MEQQIIKVVEKIILPQYPEVTHVDINTIGIWSISYVVTYGVDSIDHFREIKLLNDTVSLFNMLSPDKDDHMTVYVRKN